MSGFEPGAPSRPPPSLLCVDMQRAYSAAGRPMHAAENAQTLDACRRVLAQARLNDWTVVHTILQRDGGLFDRTTEHARPIGQLEPLASEEVYIREGLSALSHPALAQIARAAPCDADVYVIGFSLSHSLLSTAFDAASCGLRLTLIDEAVGATPVNGMTAEKVKQNAKRLLAPFASFTTFDAFEGAQSPGVVAAAWSLIAAGGGRR
jgi:nicotinamidase-related amidase